MVEITDGYACRTVVTTFVLELNLEPEGVYFAHTCLFAVCGQQIYVEIELYVGEWIKTESYFCSQLEGVVDTNFALLVVPAVVGR